MLKQYRYDDEVFEADSPDLNAILSKAHATQTRLYCLCVKDGMPMYVAKVGDGFIVKRMPATGPKHDPDCVSYEAPPGLNGRGEIEGSGIQEDTETGLTSLKFDFALSKRSGTKAPPPPGEPGDTITSEPKKLTLRGLLHYLWEEAGFNKWTPAMKGKRNWFVLRKYLYKTMELSQAKGISLGHLIYIPEPFQVENKDVIATRRAEALKRLHAPVAGVAARPLHLIVGEVKGIEATRFGAKLLVKHLPDYPLFMDDGLRKRLDSTFGIELDCWNANEDSHLIAIASFGVSSAGTPTIEKLSLSLFDDNWLPIEDAYDVLLTRALVNAGRRFAKGMRYNLKRSTPISTALLQDTENGPTAMFIVPPGADDAYVNTVREVADSTGLQSWIWQVADSSLPDLPDTVQQARE